MHFLPEKIDDYAVAHSQEEPIILQELSKETWQKVLNPRMLSGAFQGRILAVLSKLIKPKNILEIGTYTGYATLCFAEGLTSGGKITTIDKNEELETLQNKYNSLEKKAKHGDKEIKNQIELILTLQNNLNKDESIKNLDLNYEEIIFYNSHAYSRRS